MKKAKTLIDSVDKEEPFGFYETEKLVSPSLASCECGLGSGCGG